tara:strand:+ start:1642 stop:1839 length:198 start_codon:yes stop_codon:yes gene_type:complete
MEESGYETQISVGRLVARAYERFWAKNQLGVDRKGRIYRTDLPRERPNLDFLDFRQPKRGGMKDG